MKALDTIITRQEYENSPINKGGVFRAPLGVIRNFGIQPGTETDQDLDKLFKVYWQSAFDDINAFNPDRPLGHLQYIDLVNAKAESVIKDAIILQVNELLKNGLVEIKNSDQNSTGAFTSSVSPNVRIITSDQLSQDVEDKLQEIDYREWRVSMDADGLVVSLRGERLVVAKTANLIALSSLIFEGLDANDLTFLGKNKIVKIVNDELSKSRSFKGTWNSPDVASVSNIDALHANPGLTLTDGATILTPANTNPGDTILVTVSSDLSWAPEEIVWDGKNWIAITNNNLEKTDITSIKARLVALENQQTVHTTEIADLVAKVDANKAAQDVINKASATERLENRNNINSIKPEQQLNSLARIQWEDEKAEYVRLEDLQQTVKVLLSGLSWTEDANDLVLNLSTINMTKFKDGDVIVIKTGFTGASSIYLRDSFNEGSSTEQEISVNNNDESVFVTSTATEIRIASMSSQSRTWWVNNSTPLYLEQIGPISSGVDTTARKAAQVADTKAQKAQQSADTKVKKQYAQGSTADFETLMELKSLINDDDLIALTLASAKKITGRVSETGGANPIDPVVITGMINDNNMVKFGEISIDTNFNVTVTEKAANIDLSNTELKKSDNVAVGRLAGGTSQGYGSIAIGASAGGTSQSSGSIAIGTQAGDKSQAGNATAIGGRAGQTSQGYNSIAIGNRAGQTSQEYGSIAIGGTAGETSQGNNSIAIGVSAGQTNQPEKSIVISANGVEETPSASNEILLVAGTTKIKINATGMYFNGKKVVSFTTGGLT